MNSPFKDRVENLSMKYRDRLPQLKGGLFLTDGGIETSLIFDDGFDLPHFAAFPILREDRGREGLRISFHREAERFA
jgi:homocysteine S-methyltransferase